MITSMSWKCMVEKKEEGMVEKKEEGMETINICRMDLLRVLIVLSSTKRYLLNTTSQTVLLVTSITSTELCT